MSTKADVTTVRNTSGVEMYFDFLGPRGATLAAATDADIPGNIFDQIYRNPQKRASLEYALTNNLIEVLQTPQILGFDTGWNAVRRLKFNNGTVTAQDPDYGSYGGSAPST